MSQQRQFEGPDVRLLLDEICATYGPEGTIAKAESFRTGGVLGFFQKEHYRLVVEGESEDELDTEMKEPTLTYQAPSFEGANPRGRHFAGSVQKSPDSYHDDPITTSPTTTEITALPSSYQPEADRNAGDADMFASLAEDTSDSFVGASSLSAHPSRALQLGAGSPTSDLASMPQVAQAPMVETYVPAAETQMPEEDGDATFEAVLRRMAEFVEEPQVKPVTWPSARPEQPAVPPQALNMPRLTAVRPAPTAPAAAAASTPTQIDPARLAAAQAAAAQAAASAQTAAAQAAAAQSAAAQAAAAQAAAAQAAAAQAAAARMASAQVAAPQQMERITSVETPAPDAPPARHPAAAEVGADLFADTSDQVATITAGNFRPERIAGPAVEMYHPDEYSDSISAHRRLSPEEVELRLALHRVGFDLELIEHIEKATAQSSLESALLDVFESIITPPRMPRRGGSLIVVVGAGRHAAIEARRIAEEVGADPTGIAYATERRLPWPVSEELIIRSVEDAQELAPGHRRGRVGIIVVDSAVGSVGTAWAAKIIHALRPTLVVGVVDAMYKNEDISDWTDRLGGIDTFVLENVDCTVSPASLLSLEIPVNRIDESPATPTRWTAAVLDRLDPDHGSSDEEMDAVGRHFAGRASAC